MVYRYHVMTHFPEACPYLLFILIIRESNSCIWNEERLYLFVAEKLPDVVLGIIKICLPCICRVAYKKKSCLLYTSDAADE